MRVYMPIVMLRASLGDEIRVSTNGHNVAPCKTASVGTTRSNRRCSIDYECMCQASLTDACGLVYIFIYHK